MAMAQAAITRVLIRDVCPLQGGLGVGETVSFLRDGPGPILFTHAGDGRRLGRIPNCVSGLIDIYVGSGRRVVTGVLSPSLLLPSLASIARVRTAPSEPFR